MTERCWDELYRAGKALDEGCPPHWVVGETAVYFDLPCSPEAEAVHVFLDALRGALGARNAFDDAFGEAAE